VIPVLDNTSEKGFDKLPQSYTDVPPVTVSKKDPVLPKLAGPTNQIAYASLRPCRQNTGMYSTNNYGVRMAQCNY
jgi:hypothetical protein